jgi:predicted small lipoprotein YifL
MTRRTDADATGRVEPIDVRSRPSGMTIRGALAAAVLFGLAACGERGAATPPTSTSAAAEQAATEGLVLRVEVTGGFVSPSATAGRLPLVSIYADGRVISEGPTIDIYPAPALPNLQERHIDPSEVQHLVDSALAAGVADTSDLGSPPIADATTTRITLVTAENTYVREAYALTEGASETTGLTEAQRAARAELSDLVDTLTGPTADSGDTVAYAPTAMAALASAWVDPQDGLTQPEVPWPGPALPGEPLGMPDLTCVTVTGDQQQALVSAAGTANAATPWVTPDGTRWTVTLRPLLPDESSCADLQD